MLVRALLAFAALPGLIAYLVPLLIAWPLMEERPFRWTALIPLLLGTGLLVWCVREFYVTGKGTLASWDPPRHLVATGLYRLSRNPMYVAVGVILIGWAIGFASVRLLAYALAMMGVFHVRVVFFEEPWLAQTHREEWRRYSARVPRWVFRTRGQVVAAWIAAAVIVALAGLIYETVSDGIAAREFAAPGTLVDIGGRRLHLLCIGTGEPVVFFESSGWGTALSSARARESIASRTTVCSYDRSGMGWSDPATGPVSTGTLVRDLAVLQDRAKLPAPYVLVASSVGGLTAELFTRQYPERVAGIVFLDAANSLTLKQRESVSGWTRPAACAVSVLARFGVVRLSDPFGIGNATDDARRGAALTYNARTWAQLCAMAGGLQDTVREFEAAPPLPVDLPLTVLSASSSEDLMPPFAGRFVDVEQLHTVVRDSHQQLAKLSTRGKWETVPDSTHLIGNSRPDAVADAVFEMLEQFR